MFMVVCKTFVKRSERKPISLLNPFQEVYFYSYKLFKQCVIG